MKLLLALAFVALSSFGCVSGHADAQAIVTHSFTENIHLSLPAGVLATATIEELDVTSANGVSLDFIQELTVEVSAPGIATYPLVDFKASGSSGTTIRLFPDNENLIPYIEAESTTFTIAVTGTAPPQEVPLDVAITIDGEASYKKGL